MDSTNIKEEIKNESSEDNKIVFKRKGKKPLRQRVKSEESDEDESLNQVCAKVEEMKERQMLRKRPNGVSIVGLALGTKVSSVDEVITKDPFKVQSGGLVNMKALKTGKVKQVDDAYDTGIGTQFSVETNKRDEDEEMMKYIEEQLSKRKGNGNTEEDIKMTLISARKYTSPEEAALQAVPTHLRESSAKRSEEMLSNQMLSGIPEVDLGIEAKIKNIEATEEAKFKLIQDSQKKKDGPSLFVPTNMAVNFIQHNRFMADQKDLKKRKVQTEEKSNKAKPGEKASDDYHFEKFKKHFRKH